MKELAIVTGGTRGIGAAISISLSKRFNVIANYLSNHKISSEFGAANNIKVRSWNVADFKECQDAVQSIEQEEKTRVSILINNAGITKDRMMHKMSIQDWIEVIDTNLSSCFNMSKAVINKMRENEYGRIINISSVNAISGRAGQTNYCAAKSGIIGFTKSLALESASKNITVNVIAPGYVETEMTDKIDPEIMNRIISEIPLKRLGKPQDIANLALFLAGEDAGFITGQTFSVNGGHCM